MAQTIDINGVQLEANWATEETLRELVDILTKSVKTSGKSNKKSGTPVDDLNGSIAAMSNQIQQGTAANAKKSAADKKLAKEKLVRQNKFKAKLTDATSSVTAFDGSISNASGSILKFAGITGLAAGAIGLASSTLDQVIQNYTAALQAGFSFGDQLRNIRDDVAAFGLNMSAVTEMLGSSGENIRRLGDTSFDSISAFVQLTNATRTAAQDFGFFGLTAGETMQELTDHMTMLRRSGLSGNALATATQKSFMELNKEVLGFARLTGRQRRDLMRESQINADDVATGLFRNMPAGALANSKALEAGLRAMGDNGEFFKLVINKFNSSSTGLVHLMTTSQIVMESRYKDIGQSMEKFNSIMMDASSTDVDRAFALASFYGALKANEDQILSDVSLFKGTDIGETATLLQQLLIDGASMGDDGNRILAASRERMTKAEQNLMSMNDAMLRVQQTFMSQFFKMFGLDNIEEGISQEQLTTVLDSMSLAGDKAKLFVDWVVDFVGNLVGMMDTFNQSIVGDSMGARIGMMIGEALLAKVLLTAIGTAAGTAIGTAIGAMFALTGAGSIAGAFTAGLGLLFNPITIGLAVVGYMASTGITDDGLTDAGYNTVEKALIGILAKAMDWTLTPAANVTNTVLNTVLGTNLSTDVMDGDTIKEMFSSDNGQYWMKDVSVSDLVAMFDSTGPVGTMPVQPTVPNIPLVSNYGRPSDTSFGAIETNNMTPDNAWRHGASGEEYLRQMLLAITSQSVEMSKMRRAFEDSQ